MAINDYYPPILAEATPDEFLALLRDMHRQQCTYDPEADSHIVLSHESTISEWREACDLLPWVKLAEAENAYWSVAIPMKDWREVLEPAKTRKLRGVCELLARHAKLPRVRPARILGSTCVAAGVFLTVRSYLAKAGANVIDVGPSTPLDEYTRRYFGVFLGPVSQLAPGVLPLVKIRAPVYHAFAIGLLVAWIGIMIGGCGHFFRVALPCDGVIVLSLSLFAACYVGMWTIGQWTLPSSVEFRSLKTFRDLSQAIAAGRPLFCSYCGYDLRATPKCCPECGLPVA